MLLILLLYNYRQCTVHVHACVSEKNYKNEEAIFEKISGTVVQRL